MNKKIRIDPGLFYSKRQTVLIQLESGVELILKSFDLERCSYWDLVNCDAALEPRLLSEKLTHADCAELCRIMDNEPHIQDYTVTLSRTAPGDICIRATFEYMQAT